MHKSNTMMFYYAAVALAIVSNLFYNISEKIMPKGANPALAIAVAYLLALILSLAVMAVVFPLKQA